jgi:hypothetical protein
LGEPSAPVSAGGVSADTPAGAATDSSTASEWTRIVSATTLEDEVKAIEQRVADALQSEGQFKNQGYQHIQREFTVGAVLFRVIDEYGGPVRWKRDAWVAHHLLSRGALHARAPSTQVFQEAQQRRQDLQDLIRVSSLASTVPDAAEEPQLPDRRLLMQRLDTCVQEQLAPQFATVKTFERDRGTTMHHAELIAVIAHMLLQPDMEDVADEEYSQWARQLEQSALQVAAAARDDQHAAAATAMAAVKKSCIDCHEVYRAK